MKVIDRDIATGASGRVALVGSGKFARSLARTLPDAFGVVMVRDADRFATIGPLLPRATVVFSLDELAERDLDAIWIATSDRAIPEVAERIAAGRESWRGVMAIHSSGAGSIDLLAPFTRRGGSALVLHPNGSFTGDNPIPAGLLWTATASSAELLDAASRFLAPAAARIVPLDDDHRPLYHAAASVAANYSLSLFFMAVDLYRRAGLTDDDARVVVGRFFHESIERGMSGEKVEQLLTGPISRGDVEIVARQLEAIAEAAPELRRAFAVLGAMTAGMVGKNDDEMARALQES